VTSSTKVPSSDHEPELLGQTLVVIGGSSGIGLETGRRARLDGAQVILTGRNSERLHGAALELGALSTAVFDANDPLSLDRFFGDLSEPIDHVMVTAGAPHYESILASDPDEVRNALDDRLLLAINVARNAAAKLRSGGTLVFMSGTKDRHPRGGGTVSTVAAGLDALIANLALELAPIRVNLIAAGFVDTPLTASLLGNDLEARREQLRAALPIRRVVGAADVAALAVHIMINTALTGATYEIDGGQRLVA